MTSEIPELFDELRTICAQYAKEVPKKRRPWPESIKARVLRLRLLGVSHHQIAQEIGIPVMTLYSWRMPTPALARALPAPEDGTKKRDQAGFLPVRVVQGPKGLMPSEKGSIPRRVRRRPPRRPTLRTVTVKTAHPTPATLTVITPCGVRLEGLTLEQAIKAAGSLSDSLQGSSR
jgi:hypothetical protein